MNFATETLVFDPQIIRRFDINGPRYTSYPTADRFVEPFSVGLCQQALAGRRRSGEGGQRALSLYFHIPFCSTICYYCACNKIVTKDHGRSAKYLRYLAGNWPCNAVIWPMTTTGSNSYTGAAARRPSCRTMKCAS